MLYATVKTRKERRAILRVCLTIKNDGPVSPRSGLCANIDDMLDGDVYVGGVSYEGDGMDALFKGWRGGDYDGKAYPVHAALRTEFGDDMFTLDTNWDKTTKNGELRYSLLDHAIARLRELGV